MDVLRKHLLREGHLNKSELMEIIKDATKIMSKYFLHLCDYYRIGTKCNETKGTSHYRWRYPWIVLRHDTHV